MGDKPTSETKRVEWFWESLIDSYHYETTISDNERSETAAGNTAEESNRLASEKWHNKDK